MFVGRLTTMVTDSPGFMICGGAGTRLGSRRSGSFTHGRVGLGPAQPSTKFPSSSMDLTLFAASALALLKVLLMAASRGALASRCHAAMQIRITMSKGTS